MAKKSNNSRSYSGSAGDSVYGLGFIGAIVYFIQNADTFWDGAVGILQAIVWPAFVVYELLKYFGL